MSINGYLGGVISATAPTVNSGVASGIFTLEEQMQAAGQGNWPGYQISRSVRLRSSASAYLNRTLTTPTNNKIWTWSAWLKRGTIGDGGTTYISKTSLFEAPSSGSTFDSIYIKNADAIVWYAASGGGTVYYMETVPLYRDPSAWYHIVITYDSTQATSTNRQKIYVNGVEQTVTSASYVAQNTNGRINSAVSHKIGTFDADSRYADCYLTEINFVDGQALTPSSFGATDVITGVWNPIKYTGTYGTNGFYLNFSDPTSTTTIGYDYSGNSNNWTANNISVTAGTTYDSMVDSPTNYGTDTGVGGTVRGNYATFSPLDVSPSSTAQTITQGNLSLFSSSGVRIDGAYSTMAVTSGKWYVELTLTTRTNDYPTAGWCATSFNTNGSGFQYQAGGDANNPRGATIDPYGRLYVNSSTNGPAGGYFANQWAQGNIIQVAVDIDNKLIWWGKANSWSGTAGNMNGSPSAGTNGTSFSAQGGTEFKFQCCIGDSDRGDVNFGQRPFSYTAPTGFKALCTQNLSTPTINNGANYMAASLYTGTGASLTVSNAVNSISFQPDLVWVKSRSAATDHKLTDSVRGVTKGLVSNTTAAETTDTNGLTAFGSSGFTVGTDTVYNNSGATYVGWQWKASGSTVSNTTGSITSTVNANTTVGFSILTYTGNGTVGATVGHGLGATPGMVIVKSRSATADWPVKILPYMAGGARLQLDTTDAITTESAGSGSLWNATNPNSTVITLGNQAMTNTNGTTYVAYCFAPITGYSAFGSYTGNGSTDGPFVYLGFRPRWLLIKRSDSTGSWYIWDTSRSPYNQMTLALYPNLNEAEPGGDDIDFLSNGFKMRDTFSYLNTSGGTFLYAAFAENPFTISRAR